MVHSRSSRDKSDFDFLIRESRNGRAIIPFLGAGISAEVGFPPLSLLAEYLAKVQGYLHRTLYRHPDRETLARFWPPLVGRPEEGPDRDELVDSLLDPGAIRKSLYRVGWPDPNRLHADLWHYLTYACESSGVPYERRLDRLLTLEVLRGLLAKDEDLARMAWESIRGDYEPEGINGGCSRPEGETSSARSWRSSGAYWRDLLETLTRSDRDLVDSLFQVLTARRRPGLAHRYLALLTPVLRLRLFLTINFDPFLEQALHLEGLSPEVFRVSEHEPLPHPSLVRDSLSVLKLHGSGHGLRVGESLNAPIDRETESRFVEYLPETPILLVMGIGGWDERILDLLETAQKKRKGDVVWLHFERGGPALPVIERFKKTESRFRNHRVRHPGAFLEELYIRYKGGHPTSRLSYRPYPPRPIPVSSTIRTGGVTGVKGRPPLRIYEGSEDELGFEPAVRLAEFVAELSQTHQPIWVDLDTLSNVPELVEELVTQLRIYDPALPPYILLADPGEEDRIGTHCEDTGREEGPHDKAIRRIVAALGRGRYVVAFNGVEAFGREPFEHHRERLDPGTGEDRARPSRETSRLEFLLRLIERALEPPVRRSEGGEPRESETGSRDGESEGEGSAIRLRDSVLALCVHAPWTGWSPRWERAMGRLDTRWTSSPRVKVYSGEAESKVASLRASHLPEIVRGLESRSDEIRRLLVALACFRRWRSLGFLVRTDSSKAGTEESNGARNFHEVIGRRENEIYEALERIVGGVDGVGAETLLRNVEGGYLWLSRPFRDRVFDYVDSAGSGEEAGRREIERLQELVEVQQGIARHYFRDLYQPSRDVGALREHFYHRVQTIRTLKRLTEHAKSTHLKAGARRLLRRGNYEEKWFKEYRALVGTLKQEFTWLLVRTPSAALETWAEKLLGELESLKPSHPRQEDPRYQEFLDWQREGRRVLGSLLAQVYRDALNKDKQLIQLHKRKEAILEGTEEGRVGARKESSAERTEQQEAQRPQEWIDRDTFVRLRKDDERIGVIEGLLEAADGLRRVFQIREARNVSRAILTLLKAWPSLAERDGDPTEAGRAKTLAKERIDMARSRWHRLEADLALMELDPWNDRWKLADGKAGSGPGEDDLSATEVNRALCHIAAALKLLDYLPERDYLDRAYLYSLEGRAYTVLGTNQGTNLPEAYRRFDLTRAVLSRRGSALFPPEELVATCLRHAECLILHAAAGEPNAESVPAREARLAQAAELLDQGAAFLVEGRRNADWWACLFQLRAQLEVQRILLMILELDGAATARERGHQIDRATRAVRGGLDAVRRGLDVVSRQDRVRPKRFVRLWLELLVAGVHVRAELDDKLAEASGELSARRRFLDRSLQLWEQMNHQAGLERLPKGEAPKAWIRKLADDLLVPPEEGVHRITIQRISSAFHPVDREAKPVGLDQKLICEVFPELSDPEDEAGQPPKD